MDNGWTFIVVLVVAGFGGWFYWAQEDLATSAENYRSFHENPQFGGNSSGNNDWAAQMQRNMERNRDEALRNYSREMNLIDTERMWD